MIYVYRAWTLPAMAYLPQIIDKVYSIHFILTFITGWQIGLIGRVEFLNNRRVLILISTYYDTIPLYVIVYHCI